MDDNQLDSLLRKRSSINAPTHLANRIVQQALSSTRANTINSILREVLHFKPAAALALTLVLGLAIGINLPQDTTLETSSTNETITLGEYYNDINEDISL